MAQGLCRHHQRRDGDQAGLGACRSVGVPVGPEAAVKNFPVTDRAPGDDVGIHER